MFNSDNIKIIYKGEKTPLYVETNKNVDSVELKLYIYKNDEWQKLNVTFDNVVDNMYKTSYIFTNLGITLLKVTYKDTTITTMVANVKENILSKLYNYNVGNWEIKDNKMYFYDLKGKIIATYNLFDKSGNPTNLAPFKREKI